VNVETMGGQALPENAASVPAEKPNRPLRPVGIQALERSILKNYRRLRGGGNSVPGFVRTPGPVQPGV